MTDNGDVRDHEAFKGGIAVGLVAYGLVHLIVGYTAVRLALGDQSTNASQQGAFSQLAQSSAGQIGLVVLAAGFGVLVVWQGVEAVRGHRNVSGGKRWARRAGSAGKVVVYLALGASALQKAFEQSSGGGTDSMTSRLMAAPGGRYAVGAVGLGVVAIGLYLCFQGLTGRFTQGLDLAARSGGRRPFVMALGTVGHVGKGSALAAVGALFVVAAVRFQPKRTGGLDQALHTLLRQPFGPYLVGAIALGLAGFGLYCFAWARHHRT